MLNRLLAVGLLFLMIASVTSAQSLFDDSLRPTSYGALQLNDNGMTFKGGVGFWPYGGPDRERTLFRGGASVGGTCGAFDALLTYVEQFKDLPGLLQQLAGPLVAGFAFQILCETAPSFCDIIKQIYQASTLVVKANAASCQDLFLVGASMASASQRDALKSCIERKQAQGISRDLALRQCPREINAPSGINGIEEPSFGIVAKLLETAGVPATEAGLIRDLVGDITLSASGGIFSQAGDKSQDSILPKYQLAVEEAVRVVTAAVAALSTSQLPSQDILGKLGGPGYSASADALLEIAETEDEELRLIEITRYAGNLAYQKMVSDIHELADTLADSTNAAALTPEIRDQLEKKEAVLRQQVTRVQDMREASKHVENHTVELLQRRARRRAELAAIGETAVGGPMGSRYLNGQNAMGYQQ